MASAERDASEVDVLLYQMIIFCGEFFKQDFLQRCPGSTEYFRSDCALLFLRSYASDSLMPHDQVDSRNSSAMLANHSRNVFWMRDVH
jgi:hypothetical protein